MSDTLEIVEISDASIIPETSPELKQMSAVSPAINIKRQLSDLEDVRSPKKICTDIDETVTAEVTIENESEVTEESIVNESKVASEDCESEFIEPNVLDKNISIEEPVADYEVDGDDLIEEVPNKISTLPEEQEEEEHAGEEEEDDLLDYHDSEEEEEPSSDDDDDEELMARAMAASGKHVPKKSFPAPPDDDEPIALDDTDEEEENQGDLNLRRDNDASSDFSVDNRVFGESEEDMVEEEDDEEFAALQQRKKIKPHLIVARKIFTRSLKFLRKKREVKQKDRKIASIEPQPSVSEVAKKEEKILPQPALETKPKDDPKEQDVEEMITSVKSSAVEAAEPMEVSDSHESPLKMPAQELPLTEVPSLIKKAPECNKIEAEKTEVTGLNGVEVVEKKKLPVQNNETAETVPDTQPIDQDNDKPLTDNSNDSSRHETSLLTEISNSSIEEIFNRYVLKATNQSPTLDEFSEELFYCLQMNNQEIEKAKQLWNEKIHIKYKIRELMETIRRHRAVVEIETFGFKPEASGSSARPIVSSKSSTTTNSENDDKHFRMSTESVSRLIQDVRASMLKREDNNNASSAGENSQWSAMQANSAQGRQGQIVDVQSIINDFRQKNPQEIPRRGRRMKSSYGGYYDNQQMNDDSRSSRNEFNPNVTNSTNEFSSTMKSNQSGYPEVSLLPVHNLYKNLSNNLNTASGSGVGHFSGQKSSLLQSILTKQSTKSPIGFIQNSALPSTSTLARLLTAPERSFQGLPKHSNQPPPRRSSTKVHNNGEITITPIGHNNVRNKDYSMDDDENSLDPPLVIDETEDFESSDRSKISSVSDFVCQGCKKNKAFFMCAGCSRQWYCSKECQEMAWDEHAESCMI